VAWTGKGAITKIEISFVQGTQWIEVNSILLPLRTGRTVGSTFGDWNLLATIPSQPGHMILQAMSSRSIHTGTKEATATMSFTSSRYL